MNGEDIKNRRKELGWKQLHLAQRMGTSVNTVSTWERGGSIPDTTMERLKDVLYNTNTSDAQLKVDNKRTQIIKANNDLIDVLDEMIAQKKKEPQTDKTVRQIQEFLNIQIELLNDIQKALNGL